MHKRIITTIVLFGLVSLPLPQHSLAQGQGAAKLLITPVRLVMDKRTRSAELYVKNNGTAKGAYRIEIIDLKMTREKGIDEVGEGETVPYSAKDFLRISPRKITLDADGGQSVRVIARRPKDLEDGEYRAHVKVTLTDKNVRDRDQEGPSDSEGIAIKLEPRFGMTIPVLVSQGDTNFEGSLGKVNLDKAQDRYIVKAELKRQGNRSSLADVYITHVSPGGEETLVKHQPGIAVYRPLETRLVSLPLNAPKDTNLKSGKLVITYKKQAKDGGDVLDQKEISL